MNIYTSSLLKWLDERASEIYELKLGGLVIMDFRLGYKSKLMAFRSA